jgi:hypothetical protein
MRYDFGEVFRMKRLIFASSFCLAFAVASHAQEKSRLQITPSVNLLEFPSKAVSPSVSGIVRGLDLRKDLSKTVQAPSREIELKGVTPAQGGVCSVPLLEAHAGATDPGIVFLPGHTAVPIPQALVPAPTCEKK